MLQQIQEYTGYLPQLPDSAGVINVTILMSTPCGRETLEHWCACQLEYMPVLRNHQGYVHLIIPMASPLVVIFMCFQ